MTTKVKGPISPSSPQVTTPTGSTVGAPAKTEESPSEAEAGDGYQKAAQGLLSYKSSPLVSGAYKIFTDGIVFPPNLLDIKDPKNDPKYLRLLAAIFGMDEMERYFYTMSDEAEAKRNLDRVARQQEREEKGEEEEKDEEATSEEDPV
ncbi:MAG: hypothetical protein U1F57_09485 [bacterium]